MENSELAVKGSPFLGVEIKESPHFKVRYLGPDNQRLQSLGKDAATWAFSVTPVDAGQWKLHIVVTNYATENAAGRNLLTQDEIINVKVLPPMEMARRYVVEHWNWNWIWATIVLPIYGVVRRRYFPKDDKKDDNEDVPEKKAERASGKASNTSSPSMALPTFRLRTPQRHDCWRWCVGIGPLKTDCTGDGM